MSTIALPADVLLVEDNPSDAMLTRDAFHEANPFVRVHVAGDAVEATTFLRQEGIFAKAPRPDLILLDLKLGLSNGFDVLALLKEEGQPLRTIPALVLTATEDESSVARSYELQANCFLRKPLRLDEFSRLVKNINDFWLTAAQLPRERNGH